MWPDVKGAARRLPVDATPLDTAAPDTRSRVAWLLRVNRLASPYGGVTAATWRGLLNLPDEVGDDPTISKIERGRLPASPRLMSRYETLLQLPPGTLRGVTDAMCRALNPPTLRRRQVSGQPRLIDVLDERIRTDLATGSDWLTLADTLATPGSEHIPGRVLDDWLRRLLLEFTRAAGSEYVSRLEALCALVAMPGQTHRTERLLREVAGQPNNPCTADLLDLLSDSVRPGIAEDLITEFAASHGARQWGVTLALTCQIGYGNLTADQLSSIQTIAQDRLRTDSVAGTRAHQLLHAIRLRHRDDRAYGSDALATHLRNAPGLRHYVAAARQYSGMDDPTLVRLLREALTTVFLPRTHHAQMLIYASPYRNAVADTALDIVASPGASGPERRAAGRLVVNLAGEPQHPRLIRMLRHRDEELRAVAVGALYNQPSRPAALPEALDDGRWSASRPSAWWREHGTRPRDDLRAAAAS